MTVPPEIVFEQRGSAGVVTLNRPRAMNAVTHGMVRAVAGELGTYCAPSGQRLRNADAVPAGIATHYVATTKFPELIEALTGAQAVDVVLDRFSERLGTGPLAGHREAIDRLFAGNRVEDI